MEMKQEDLLILSEKLLRQGSNIGAFLPQDIVAGENPVPCPSYGTRAYVVKLGVIEELDDDCNGTKDTLLAGVEIHNQGYQPWVMWLAVYHVSFWGRGPAACGGWECRTILAIGDQAQDCITPALVEFLDAWMESQA